MTGIVGTVLSDPLFKQRLGGTGTYLDENDRCRLVDVRGKMEKSGRLCKSDGSSGVYR